MNAPGQMVQATFGNNIGANFLEFEYNYAYTSAGRVSAKTLELQSTNHLINGGGYANGAITANYTYDGQGVLTSVAYPLLQSWIPGTTQTFTVALDALERPTGMTDQNNTVWASGANYNAANQPLYDGTATRAYNVLNQMTSITATGLDMTYNRHAEQRPNHVYSRYHLQRNRELHL